MRPPPPRSTLFPYTTLFRSSSSSAGTAPSARQHRSSPKPESPRPWRSEEHTSELQSRGHLVCRLLLEKKKLAIALTRYTDNLFSDETTAGLGVEGNNALQEK